LVHDSARKSHECPVFSHNFAKFIAQRQDLDRMDVFRTAYG
jgi:hypothetical protein